MELRKGAHAPVPTSLLAVVLSWESTHAVDVHALLVTESGLVRGDGDFVFFNAPRHVSQAVTLDQQPALGTARLSVSLPRTEPEVARIVISASIDDATFDELTEFTLTVHAADGPIATFAVDGIEDVQAMMFGEFYRRDGQWRFRAIGQGWAGGLAGLATEFGVTVDESVAGHPDLPESIHTERSSTRSSSPGFADTRDRTRLTATATRHDTSTPERPDANQGAGRTTDSASRSLDKDASRSSIGHPSPSSDDHTSPFHNSHTSTPPDGHTPPPHNGRTSPSPNDHTSSPGDHTPPPHNGRTSASPDGRMSPSHAGRPTPRPPALTRRVIDVPPPPPPDPDLADWHPDPDAPGQLRWWDGDEWTTSTRPHIHDHRAHCGRCGNPLRRRFFGGHSQCKSCTAEIEEFLTHWRNRAIRVMTGPGTQSMEWIELWAALRFQRIDEQRGRAVLHDVGVTHVERMVAFAFADGEVFAEELEAFEHVVSELALGGGIVDDLRRRMHRGRTLSRLRGGELPTVDTPGLHLDPDERVHLDLPAVHVRSLARGPRNTEGRLIASTKKLRFVGDGTGIELPWNRVVSVHPEHGTVVLAATSARGGATFGVTDPDYVAAALEGALRVSKRLVLTPGQRDTRSIPQDVKAQVWQRDGGRCVECGDGHYLEFDHIIPLSRGGATSMTNLQILCRACNRAKGARI
ncbi:TerD family protein [Nocardia sp. NPDC058176]|uniref:TerD family protein n=1 Tax=Nocardia sp. NPDC058176 TaxID=3346368 RepID=UPI0036DD14E4